MRPLPSRPDESPTKHLTPQPAPLQSCDPASTPLLSLPPSLSLLFLFFVRLGPPPPLQTLARPLTHHAQRPSPSKTTRRESARTHRPFLSLGGPRAPSRAKPERSNPSLPAPSHHQPARCAPPLRAAAAAAATAAAACVRALERFPPPPFSLHLPSCRPLMRAVCARAAPRPPLVCRLPRPQRSDACAAPVSDPPTSLFGGGARRQRRPLLDSNGAPPPRRFFSTKGAFRAGDPNQKRRMTRTYPFPTEPLLASPPNGRGGGPFQLLRAWADLRERSRGRRQL